MPVAFRIALLSTTAESAPRLRAAVGRRASVTDMPTGDALLDAVGQQLVDVSVVELRGAGAVATVTALRRLRDAFPLHPVVAWCDLRTIEVPMLLEVARLGVTDLLRGDVDDLRHTFGRTFATALQRSVAFNIQHALSPVVPRALMPLVEYMLERVGEPLDRDDVAAAFAISRRTLHSRLVEAGLPSAGLFITWTRVLVATALLDQPGYTLERAAAQLNLGSAGALANLLVRYTGRRARDLRKHGALRSATAVLAESVAAALLARETEAAPPNTELALASAVTPETASLPPAPSLG